MLATTKPGWDRIVKAAAVQMPIDVSFQTEMDLV